MARARNIKPGLFKNEILGVADPLLTILFQSLWCLADREGRLEDRPLRIKAETFPYREGLDVNGYLTELARLGFISRYSVSGCSYIQVLNFAKHQNPHNTEKKSEIPEMSEESVSCALTVSTPLNNGTSRADSLNLIPDPLVLKPSSPAVAERQKRAEKTVHDESFEQAWAAYPKRPGASKTDALKAWTARIKEGSRPEDMIAGVHRYAEYIRKSSTDPTYIKQPATFFGPGKHYEADWAFAGKPNGPAQNDKFMVAHLDHSSSRAAMEQSMKRHNIVVPEDGDIPF